MVSRGIDLALVRGPGPRSGYGRLVLPPLGLLSIAAAAEMGGWRVAVVDAPGEGLSQADFLERLRTLRPFAIGLTGMTPMREQIARDISATRHLCERLVLGGVHATRFQDRALAEFKDLDALVIGEGDHSICELLSYWAGGERGLPPAGVLIRGEELRPAEAPTDLDALPFPARHLVSHHRYRYVFQTRPRFTTMVSSRGCPFRCTFCDKTVSGSAWRARSANNVVDELEEIRYRFDIGSVCLFDDNFTLRRKRVVAICEEILRRGLDIHWKCEARVDGVDRELTRLMAAAGCKTIAFGLESGNQSSLDLLQKDQQVASARTAIQAAASAGIETVGYALVGIPGETPTSSRATLKLARETGLDFIQFSTLSPYEGTELFQQAQDSAWLRQTRVRNPADAEELRATLLAPGWSEKQLDRTLRQLYGGFYLRPGYLARQALRASRNGVLTPRARLGLELARWWVGRDRVAAAGSA
ncbi:MAG: hypothetical protein CMP23_02770 [Rickettsiales bacterium]|nr:hypothetical protein [Rickettsiales bacterium]